MQRSKLSYAGPGFGMTRSRPLTAEEAIRARCKASQTKRNKRVRLSLRMLCPGCDQFKLCRLYQAPSFYLCDICTTQGLTMDKWFEIT